jgi:hypothetical protein
MAIIYQFSVYDISNDETRKARRWGTKEAIARIRVGILLEETATEVDASVLDENGMTSRDFDPHRRAAGFQTTVSI